MSAAVSVTASELRPGDVLLASPDRAPLTSVRWGVFNDITTFRQVDGRPAPCTFRASERVEIIPGDDVLRVTAVTL